MDTNLISEKIRTIWIEELDAPEREWHKITPEADFLAIGGDSMKFIKVYARLEEAFDISVDEDQMAAHRTIALQCALVEKLSVATA